MINKLLKCLAQYHVDPAMMARIMEGYEDITNTDKERRPAFLVHAMAVMDEMLDFPTRAKIRGACACSKSGWRERAVRQIAREYEGQSLQARLEALGQVKYMGYPTRHEDGTISGGVGTEGGFDCPCPALKGWRYEEPVSPTYCLCCAGHFRHHYQIALGVKLQVKEVLSTALASQRRQPCRFVFEIMEGRHASGVGKPGQ